MKLSVCFLLATLLVSPLSAAAQMANSQAAAPSAAADVPRLVKFSGTATDETGKPFSGVVGVTFSLYKEQQGGAPLWVEIENVQADANGHYTAMLGANTSGGVPLEIFSSAEAHWVAMQISGQREQPRVLLLSVPYALKAADAETLGGLPASAFVHATPNPAAGVAAANAGSSAPATPSPAAVSGKGTKNYIPIWTSGTALGNSAIYQTSGQVGVGTKTPGAEVDSVSTGIAVRGISSGKTGVGVLGNATSSSGVNFGVSGQSASMTTGAAGVAGRETATTGYVFGISGAANSTTNFSAGVSGSESATTGQVYGVVGVSNSTTNGAAAVSGYEPATTGAVFGVNGSTPSSSNGAAGMNGYAAATTGAVYGVNGGTASTTNGAAAVNGFEGAATGQVYGVSGGTSSTSGTGVLGFASATSGNTDGVLGFSSSPNGTGVVGEAASTGGGYGVFGGTSATTGFTVGVFGQSASSGGVGVLGKTVTAGGTSGLFVNQAGSGLILQGQSGNNFQQVFYVDASGNGGFSGNLNVTGKLTKGSGSFKIDHPLDPANKYLSHSFVESPDMMNFYSGVVMLDAHGSAWVTLPDYFEALNRDFRYQLTAVGVPGPNLYIAMKVSGNRFKIAGGKPRGEVSWQVTGIRHDAYANAYRIPTEEDKPAAEQGYYLHPEVFGQPDSKSIQAASQKASARDQLAKASNP
jgi:hypothetical protein